MITYNVRNFKIKTKEALDLVAQGEVVLLIRGGQIFKVEKYAGEPKRDSESLPSVTTSYAGVAVSEELPRKDGEVRHSSLSEKN